MKKATLSFGKDSEELCFVRPFLFRLLKLWKGRDIRGNVLSYKKEGSISVLSSSVFGLSFWLIACISESDQALAGESTHSFDCAQFCLTFVNFDFWIFTPFVFPSVWYGSEFLFAGKSFFCKLCSRNRWWHIILTPWIRLILGLRFRYNMHYEIRRKRECWIHSEQAG